LLVEHLRRVEKLFLKVKNRIVVSFRNNAFTEQNRQVIGLSSFPDCGLTPPGLLQDGRIDFFPNQTKQFIKRNRYIHIFYFISSAIGLTNSSGN